MKKPVWVNLDAVFIFHEEQLLEFGGPRGSATGRDRVSARTPAKPFAYGQPDLFDLACRIYGWPLPDHGFVDGNKRTAFLTGVVFLVVNGYEVMAEQAEVVAAMLELAYHQLDEIGCAQWFREHAVPV